MRKYNTSLHASCLEIIAVKIKKKACRLVSSNFDNEKIMPVFNLPNAKYTAIIYSFFYKPRIRKYTISIFYYI